MPVSEETKLPDSIENSRLLSFNEARKFLGVGKMTMQRLIANTKDPVPFIRIGRNYKFQTEKLLWWIEKQAQ